MYTYIPIMIGKRKENYLAQNEVHIKSHNESLTITINNDNFRLF